MRVAASMAVGLLLLALPASAAQQLFSFTSTAFLNPSGTPIAALSGLAGGTVAGAFLIDTAAATLEVGGPVGGQGQSARLLGAVTAGIITINGPGGSVTLVRNANDLGGIFTVNNGGVPPFASNRIDQMGYSTGSRVVSGSIVKPYDIFGTLPPDVFFGSLFFGRTQQAPFTTPPELITDVTTRDFAGVLTGAVGNAPFMQITFRQGDPNGSTLTGLPLQGISLGLLQLTITNVSAVPEPKGWAMLIAGFGLVGAVARRRRAALAA